MRELLTKRVALITGKGGVGRSTVTAAIAHVAQRAGKRVLIAEAAEGSEGYSPLALLFGQTHLPRTAAEVAPGIFGSQLRSETGVELFLSSVIKVRALARSALEFEPLRRLFLAVPSLRELGIFFHLLTYLRATGGGEGPARFDLILLDMPATGHTLALTGLPEVILRLVQRGPIADALREGQSYLNSPQRAGAYVVTLPEELPVSESLELLEGLERTAVPCGGVFINKVPTNHFTREETEALHAFLPGKLLYGADGFQRIQEARLAITRLRSSTRLPAIEIPELEPTGPELIASMAALLEPALRGAEAKR